jgi:chromosome segregation ATPase
MNSETTKEVVNLSPPQEWLYKCDCPKCISGAHFNKDIAESYRKRGELNNEVARLREELEKMKGEATREIMLRDKIEKRCEIAERELTEKTNEVARLREEASNWHQHYRDEASKAQKCKQAYIEQENEVARLREELQKLKEDK